MVIEFSKGSAGQQQRRYFSSAFDVLENFSFVRPIIFNFTKAQINLLKDISVLKSLKDVSQIDTLKEVSVLKSLKDVSQINSLKDITVLKFFQ